MIDFTAPIRKWVIIGVAIAALCLCFAILSMCSAQRDASRARSEASIAKATGKALDNVAQQTPVIRREQQEKQDAVREIPGADQRLPDGFGADLERVRRNSRDNDPR